MKFSIVCATYNRATLLDRSLASYARQTLPADQWEYLIVDDFSTDHTREVVEKWSSRVPVTYVHARDLNCYKEPGQWRDGSRLRNRVSLRATGEYLVGTYPEILVPAHTLQSMAESLAVMPHQRIWLTTIPYWLPDAPEGFWDRWDASQAQFAALHELPGFYDSTWPTPTGGIDYRSQNQERRTDWESDGVLWAMPMHTWRWLGGFREFDTWGSIDMDFWERRRIAMIETHLALAPQSPHKEHVLMVYHQPHGGQPNSVEDAMEAIRQRGGYQSREGMRAQGGIAGFYLNGVRERAAKPGTLEGIDPAAVARYEWAAERVKDDRVVDCPMGTGYGAVSLKRTGRAYLGVDHDAESVAWAQSYNLGLVMVGKMEKIPLPRWTADTLVCFGGFDGPHPPAFSGVAAEWGRVVKPGGRLLVSVRGSHAIYFHLRMSTEAGWVLRGQWCQQLGSDLISTTFPEGGLTDAWTWIGEFRRLDMAARLA